MARRKSVSLKSVRTLVLASRSLTSAQSVGQVEVADRVGSGQQLEDGQRDPARVDVLEDRADGFLRRTPSEPDDRHLVAVDLGEDPSWNRSQVSGSTFLVRAPPMAPARRVDQAQREHPCCDLAVLGCQVDERFACRARRRAAVSCRRDGEDGVLHLLRVVGGGPDVDVVVAQQPLAPAVHRFHGMCRCQRLRQGREPLLPVHQELLRPRPSGGLVPTRGFDRNSSSGLPVSIVIMTPSG